jgi:hypothetical protein
MFCLCDLRVLRGEIISDVPNWSFPYNREKFNSYQHPQYHTNNSNLTQN